MDGHLAWDPFGLVTAPELLAELDWVLMHTKLTKTT
jgi:hypothetical protein